MSGARIGAQPAGHHSGVQRRGLDRSGAGGAERGGGPDRRRGRLGRLRGPDRRRRPRSRASPSSSSRSTSGSAGPCAPASTTRCCTATTSASSSTPTANTTPPRSRSCSCPCAGRRHGHRQPVRRHRRAGLRRRMAAAPGDGPARVAGHAAGRAALPGHQLRIPGLLPPDAGVLRADLPVEYMDSVEALVLASNAGFCVEEVRATMRPRASGEPSTRRVKLVYYYVRLIVVMLSSAQRRGRHRDGGPSR